MRSQARRTGRKVAPLDGIDPSGPIAGPGPGERAELRAAIDAEIARLPARYREAVFLCHIEGLDPPTAARRLRVPLGTLQSRLHRARHRLRRALIRRGIVPAALGSVLASVEGAASGVMPASRMMPVLLRGIAMKKVAWIVGIAIGLAGLGGGVGLAHRRGDDTPVRAAGEAVKPGVAERIRAVMDEYNRAEAKANGTRLVAGLSEEKWHAWYRQYEERFVEASRKLLSLIEENPADPESLKAMLWHVSQYWTSGTSGPLYDQLIRSADVVVRHYADEPLMAWRVLVRPSTLPTRLDDRLTPGLVARARRREAKGFALLALGEHLEEKAAMALAIQQHAGRFHIDLGDGTKSEKPIYDEAYENELRACDAADLRKQAEAQFARVVAEYGDVIKYERDPVDKDFNTTVESRPIGDEAAERLAALRGAAIGKAAPDLTWTKAGATTRLSDLRGKVVVLTFREQGNEPSDRQAARLAQRAARLKGRPLSVVDLPSDSPVAARFGVRRFPSTIVIDADGILRFMCGWSPLISDYVECLVTQAEAKALP